MLNLFCCWNRKESSRCEEEPINFIPPITGGKVIKVYDGDTITISSRLPYNKSPLYKFRVRLAGIDCPEIRSSNEEEGKYAVYVRDILRKLIMGRKVNLSTVGMDKYGRVLANVTHEGRCINAWMVERSFAVPYDGKTKAVVDWGSILNRRMNI